LFKNALYSKETDSNVCKFKHVKKWWWQKILNLLRLANIVTVRQANI